MKTLMAWKQAYLKDENGATAIEYGLIAGAVSLAIAGVVTTFGGELFDMWNSLTGEMNTSVGNPDS